LRAIRAIIFAHEQLCAFGGLRRVQTPAGDLLWVCGNHYADYDPGLPVIQERKPPPWEMRGQVAISMDRTQTVSAGKGAR
jgi:hypothetical protein